MRSTTILPAFQSPYDVRGLLHVFSSFLAVFLATAGGWEASGAEPLRRLGRPGGDRLTLAADYDADGNGVLEKEERVAARMAVHDLRQKRVVEELLQKDADEDGKISKEEMSTGRRSRGSAPFDTLDTNGDGLLDVSEIVESMYRTRSGAPYDLGEAERLQPGGDLEHGAGLYDEGVVRTFFLQFEDDDWLDEMHDFYRTDVCVPADLIVGGQVYESVGVRYRGNSSFRSVPPHLKRSLDIQIDHGDADQHLLGYKTINLLNAHDDPTFLREVLYSRICRDYMPAFKANFVRLAINGESWGIYPNVQQYNKDFLEEWFGSRGGVRWKGRGSLTYEGAELDRYTGRYIVKTDDAPEEAWTSLVELCRVLQETPDESLEEVLSPILDIDGALWSIALENIFVDEGYLIRGSDYNLFRDVNGRFHLLQHDGNEVLNRPGGPGIPRGMDATKMPLYHEANNEGRPLAHRLLSHPYFRARYTAHVRTILDDWLNWETMGPVVAGYRALIDETVRKDIRKESGYEDFAKGDVETVKGGRVLGIKQFVDRRREFLLSHAALQAAKPEIQSVHLGGEGESLVAGVPVPVTVGTSGETKVQAVTVLWALDPHHPFEKVSLVDDGRHGDGEAGDGVFGGELPALPVKTQVYYYVEAGAGDADLTLAYLPAKAESAPFTYQVRSAGASSLPLVITEVLANNKKTVTDPQGDHDDYIEIHNASDEPVDLAGMYLTDSDSNPRKFQFPVGSWIAPRGFLLVWADEDGKDTPGIHANFKIAARGETIRLIDRDNRGNGLVSSVTVAKTKSDRSYSRVTLGNDGFQSAKPSPGRL